MSNGMSYQQAKKQRRIYEFEIQNWAFQQKNILLQAGRRRNKSNIKMSILCHYISEFSCVIVKTWPVLCFQRALTKIKKANQNAGACLVFFLQKKIGVQQKALCFLTRSL